MTATGASHPSKTCFSNILKFSSTFITFISISFIFLSSYLSVFIKLLWLWSLSMLLPSPSIYLLFVISMLWINFRNFHNAPRLFSSVPAPQTPKFYPSDLLQPLETPKKSRNFIICMQQQENWRKSNFVSMNNFRIFENTNVFSVFSFSFQFPIELLLIDTKISYNSTCCSTNPLIIEPVTTKT